jgi:hypothetical protein
MMRKLTGRVFVALVLGAWAASLAQADARQRGGKHTATAARQAAQPHRPAPAPAFTPKNAIGAAAPPARIGPPVAGAGAIPPANAVGAVKANAIATRPWTVGSIHVAPAGAAKIGPAASPAMGIRPSPPALAAHGGGISGTGLTRPGTAPGTVGGPAKIAGGITGTGLKPKR